MSIYGQLSDFELTGLLNKGDQLAFREIYNRYNSLLLIYAYRKLEDKEEAKDVVQEVFAGLWTNHTELQIKTTLSGYLYRIVLNKILNIFRHKDFGKQYVDAIQHLVDSDTSATDYLIREKEMTAMIEKEIAGLPAKMREVFELRRKEYLSNKEIAERLRLSEHTVATQMKKALKVIRLRFGRL
ncbi:RNA polymerase sigma-70 factor [Pedobacter frigoris]|uniref:RNA polymerase sigma-70 factor n=1 Tax=Pedobacter frigoris TaxID=2571272 RepID=UPI0029300314|nr:RNA polymerase sigma-70 factor [Pedobacter frigoris]